MAKVMIISENNELSLAIKYVLRREGHDVEIMPTFCESEAYLYSGGNSAVILIDSDAIHHCRAGKRASEKLRSITKGNARIIYLATKGSDNASAEGADTIVYKPFTAHDIQTEVRNALATL